ncbi:SGF29 tudor-like domain-domain-containing protein [Yarrowia lipolytica]|uniref:YALI0E14080p n=2 Tax=Yarrowia lipolytica TaxID=4952 RepID=Q6C5Y4_YARLI|nr:YALI0E14080p [Yarrowia lipolytica CLIB122]AOW05400.1 hypothetical protein YALI1_E17141g [Yarrowia lipolytica]KAB8282098.1 SGF29 tudor-like domain-containing protein [Yarrowia lipolytica]KAE8171144.1 SGF29 tudor-like domain-containing protein [Yarrowia lipolytica]KAJ8056908.1 SGF29 tudor-like domain-containing protein [Yarrowia lipolytica]RDW28739.1 SGF29 tudor-like domain-domain-containing protein [Yarrowia lipolytica]|eukprot:XP_503928.1 YALI0E14080p [Yarrowia lipolytica CLIB122]
MPSHSRSRSNTTPMPEGDEAATWRNIVTSITSLQETDPDISRLQRKLIDTNGLSDQTSLGEMLRMVREASPSESSLDHLQEVLTTGSEVLSERLKCLDGALEYLQVLIAVRTDYPEDSKIKRRKVEEDKPSTSYRRPIPRVGSQVAFRLRKQRGDEEEEWIQCQVTRVYSDGQRFEVKDPEPDENGNPGQSYKTSIRDIIPLPTDEELRNMPQFTAGSQVLARYPETTTFYRAEVTGTRRDKYRLKFEGEDDADKETEVSRGLVLNIPK